MTDNDLGKYKEVVFSVLVDQWWRDPRDGKALDCLHFDEYCDKVLQLKTNVDMGLFSVDTGLRASLKAYTLYVVLYTLGLRESEVESQENLQIIKEEISKTVENNWPEYYFRMENTFSIFLRQLHKVV